MPKSKLNDQKKNIQLCNVPDAKGMDTLKPTAADNTAV